MSSVPERQRRVIEALGAGGPATPEALRERVQGMPARRPAAPRLPALRIPRLAFAGVTAAVLAIAVVVVLSIATPGGPTVVQAAAIVHSPADQGAPAVDPRNPALLQRKLDGVTFPDWSKEFGWRALGARKDNIDGRRTSTVFYYHEGHRIAYTVVSGKPLDPPDGARKVRIGGLTAYRFRDRGHQMLTFERNGRTCVLGGHVLHRETLNKLAAWKGDGAVSF